MISNGSTSRPNPPADSPASPLSTDKGATPAVLDPRSPIEVASGGNGTTIDPAAKDTKPPGVYDHDSLA
jgi:hypothetical protein